MLNCYEFILVLQVWVNAVISFLNFTHCCVICRKFRRCNMTKLWFVIILSTLLGEKNVEIY